MNHKAIIEQLSNNIETFNSLFARATQPEYLWKPAPEKWCMLEVLCHLLDEEREDFGYRVKHTLQTPTLPLPPINPQGWVGERKYIEKDYYKTLADFKSERQKSAAWLQSLVEPEWKNTHQHPKLGPISAETFLANWLTHDYLHFRQIVWLKFGYWKEQTGETFEYAGTW